MRAHGFPPARHPFQKVGVNMLVFRKELTPPALEEKTVSLSLSAAPRGESGKSGVLYPEECLNFRAENGVLRGGAGTEIVLDKVALQGYVPSAAYLFGRGAAQKLVFFSEGGLYSLTLPEGGESGVPPARLGSAVFAAPPFALPFVTAENGDVLLFSAPEGTYLYDGTDFSVLEDAPAATCGCVYYDRLFLASASIPYRLHFSVPLDGSDWEHAYRAAGYVDLSPEHGEITALLPCGKKIYALRGRGLTLLRAEGENAGFSAEPVPAAFGAVFENSAQCVGEHILFLASDGLYAFDGSEAKRCAAPWLAAAPPAASPACRSAVRGAYYVLSYLTASGARRTLFYDPAAEDGFLSDTDMSLPACGEDGPLFFTADGALVRFTRESARAGAPLKKIWRSGSTRLGLGAGRKQLRRLTLVGKGNFKLTVEGEHAREKLVYALAADGETSVQPLLKGRRFSVCVESEDADCTLERLEVSAAILKEV